MPPNTSGGYRKESIPDVIPDQEKKDRINCVVVGDSTVGKTSLIVSYTSNGYPEKYVPTVHDYYTVRLTVEDRPLMLQLVDTAGQGQFEMIRRLSYPDAEIFLLCFNICDPDSFNNVRDKWVPELREYRPKVPIILVGTQVDQRNNVDVKCRLNMKGKKPVTPDEGEHCAKKIGAKKYIECSALTQKNLKATFDSAIIVALESKEKKDRNRFSRSIKLSSSLRRLSSIRKSIRSFHDKRSSTHSGSSSSSSDRGSSSGSEGVSTYSKTFNPDDFEQRNPFHYLLCLG